MAVAAYGSLLSLIHVLDNIHYRAELHNLHVDIKLIESLQDGVNRLVDYFDAHSESEGYYGDLWRQISRVAVEAEQMFDNHVVEQFQLRSDDGERDDLGFLAFNQDVEAVLHNIDIFKKELSVVEEVTKDRQTGRQPRIVAPPSPASLNGKSTKMVGFDKDVRYIIDWLKSDEKRGLQVVPIVGMGGIGKTTLARNVYGNDFINKHFDIRMWHTISQEYSVHEILVGLLNDGANQVKSQSSGNRHILGETLYKMLHNRRYLIVLDDVWDPDVWVDLRMFFPENGNGSRVIITTRLTHMAKDLSWPKPYVVQFLRTDECWTLLCLTIFGQETCPHAELEKVGKLIAKNCKGLPLAVVVIGGQLANSDITKEYWLSVAENMKLFASAAADEHCMKVLYLSYTNLPIHLKLCFLYTRVYPEDVEIQVAQLIDRWIAEGVLRPQNGKDLQEIGKNYIKDLAARNIISWYGTLSTDPEDLNTCHIHDLLRDLCVREWQKEQFSYSHKVQIFKASSTSTAKDACCNCGNLIQDLEGMHHQECDAVPPSTPKVSLVACKDCEKLCTKGTKLRLVKVANIVEYGSNGNYNFRKELEQPTQLRNLYIDVQNYSFLEFIPHRLRLLWNLQTLVFNSFSTLPVVLPPEIWEMPQLRRIHSNKSVSVFLPDPAVDGIGGSSVILKNLFSLNRVLNFKCTMEILDRIPNLRELAVEYQDELLASTGLGRLHSFLCNLTHLQRLEFLWMKNASPEHVMIFPNSLIELYLKRCKIPWEDVSIIGALPNLQRLTLHKSGEGLEWTPIEGGFRQLQTLCVRSSNLRCWNADSVHFPVLQLLVLWGLVLLEKIPSEIGDIGTLRRMFVVGCSKLAMKSAKKIRWEQKSIGNETPQVTIRDGPDGDDMELELSEDDM